MQTIFLKYLNWWCGTDKNIVSIPKPKKSKKEKIKKQKQWKRWKKYAPKVPDITCPDIDHLLDKLDQIAEKQKLTGFQHKKIIQRLEQLRAANDSLRSSGVYWYDICKDNLKD